MKSICEVKTMDYILADQKLTVSENFLLSLLDAITRVKKQIDKTSFKDDEREMAFIVRKNIRELECKITTAFHWWYLQEYDPIPEKNENDPFFDTKQKRVCYLNNEMLRWATELYTDDSRCKGDSFFESRFFKQNIKPELAYIYVSLKNAKIDECGFVVPR
jgi:hypothetical protein